VDIVNEIKASFKRGSYLTQLIYINLAVFVFINLVSVVLFLFGTPAHYSPLISWLALPAETNAILFKPWTFVSYMFLHEGFLHLLFNLLWLYWFGRIFMQYLDQKQLLSVYLLGGACRRLCLYIGIQCFSNIFRFVGRC
jgi:membrane associated rhomboid family serine protease